MEATVTSSHIRENGDIERIPSEEKGEKVQTDSLLTTRVEVKVKVKDPDDELKTEQPALQGQPKNRILKTVCIYVAFCSVGLCTSTLGSSFVDVEILLNTDTKNLALTFVFHNFGYIAGSLILGLIYHHLNPELQFMAASLLIGVTVAVAPFTGVLAGFIFFITLMAVGQAYIDAGTQPYLLTMWTGHSFQRPFLQGAHTSFALGACIGPVIMQPFLLPTLLKEPSSDPHKMNRSLSVEMADHGENHTYLAVPSVVPNETMYDISVANGSSLADIIEELADDGIILRVQYGFMTIGFLCLPAFFLFLLPFFLGKCRLTRIEKPGKDKNHKGTHPGSSYAGQIYIFLAMLFGIFMCYMVVEGVSSSFIATYVIKGLLWDKYKGPLIQMVLWAAGFAGRFLAIPASFMLTPVCTIAINLSLTTLGSSLMLLSVFVRSIPEGVMWIAVGLTGLGFSSFWPNMTLWAAAFVEIDATAAAVITIGGSTGCIVGPLLTGYMLQYYTPDAFVYILFAGNALLIMLYLLASVHTKKFKLLSAVESGSASSLHQEKTEHKIELKPLKESS